MRSTNEVIFMGGFLLFKIIGTVCHAVSEARKPYLTEEESCRRMGIKPIGQQMEEYRREKFKESQGKIDEYIRQYNEAKEKFLAQKDFFLAQTARVEMFNARLFLEKLLDELKINNQSIYKMVKVNVEFLDDDFIRDEMRRKQERENDKKEA